MRDLQAFGAIYQRLKHERGPTLGPNPPPRGERHRSQLRRHEQKRVWHLMCAGDDLPELGVEVAWAEVEKLRLRLVGFDSHSTRVGDKVTGPPTPLPYATAEVEVLAESGVWDGRRSYRESYPAALPVVHREDFKVLDWLWESGAGALDIEIHYRHRRGLFGRFKPRLDVTVYPEGTLSRLTRDRDGMLSEEVRSELVRTVAAAQRGETTAGTEGVFDSIFSHPAGPFTCPD